MDEVDLGDDEFESDTLIVNAGEGAPDGLP